MSAKFSYTARCDSCGASVKWAGLAEPLDLDAALLALGWSEYGNHRHKCRQCQERAASFDAALWDAASMPDLADWRIK